MIHPLCLLLTFWKTLRFGWPHVMEGCDYVETINCTARVSVLTCERCGKVSVSWTRI